jgi:hypothetical protein
MSVQMTEKLLLATEDDIWAIKRHNSKQQDTKQKIIFRVGKEHSSTPKTYDLFVKQEYFTAAFNIVRFNVPVTTDLSKDEEFYMWLDDS